MEPAPDPSPFAAATGHDGLEEGRPSSAASSAPGHTTPSALDRRHSSKSRDWPEILRQFSDPPVIGATLARPTSLKCSVSLAAWHTNPQVDVGPTGSTQNQDIVLEGSGLGSLLWLSASLSGTNLASFAIGLVGLAFIGRIGEAELAAAVLATILFNMTGLSFMQGLNAALETFCGQAWGSGNFPAVGIALQRAMCLNTVATAIVTGLWLHAEQLLVILGQDRVLSQMGARYLLLMLPALWLTAMFEGLKRYLAAQGIGSPVTIATMTALACSPPLNWFFIFHLNLGLDGAAYAMVGTSFLMASLLAAIATAIERDRIRRGDPQSTWPGWSAEAFHEWGLFLSCAAPSIVMVCTEWWSFEMLVIMSGWLPNAQTAVAVMGLCLNLSGAIWMVVSGVGMACSATVAAALGAGDWKAAQRTTLVSVVVGLALELGAAAIVLLARRQVGAAFTDAQAVITCVASLMPVFAASLPGDGINCVLQGFLRGSGKQSIGALANILSYWVVGLPVAYALAFQAEWGVQGLWAGVVVVNTLLALTMAVVTARTDFRLEAAKAGERAGWLVAPLLARSENAGRMDAISEHDEN